LIKFLLKSIAFSCPKWYFIAMKFEELLNILKNQVIFESSLLFAGYVDQKEIRRQLSRWKKTGKIIQLCRGLYILAKPYRTKDPHPFVII
jgi:hypothetical protein